MNTENYILISNITDKDIEKIVSDFIEMYKESGINEINILRKKDEPNLYKLELQTDIDFHHFLLAVNYFFYPIGMTYRPSVYGYWNLMKDNPHKLMGNRCMLYVSEDAPEDSVIVVSDTKQRYRIDMRPQVKYLEETEKTFEERSYLDTDFEYVIVIVSSQESDKRVVKTGCLGMITMAIICICMIASISFLM